MPRSRQSGFTLVEILVVVSILMVLTALAIYAFNRSTDGDRIREAARTAQSAFMGAHDRALHAKDKRGIRLIRDVSDPTIVTGFAYVQPIENQFYPEGSIRLERRDEIGGFDGLPDSADIVIVRGFTSPDSPPYVDWPMLTEFFSSPPRIRIPAKTGQWYTFYWTTTGPYALSESQPILQLTTPFIDPGLPSLIAHPRFPASANTSCELEMAPELLPHHPPILFPSGIVIDLDFSSPFINANWPPGTSIDLMYSPRGNISGPVSAQGPIHLLLNSLEDAVQNLNPIDPANKSEKRILSIVPLTGRVATYDIDPSDANQDGQADDLFRFARYAHATGN